MADAGEGGFVRWWVALDEAVAPGFGSEPVVKSEGFCADVHSEAKLVLAGAWRRDPLRCQRVGCLFVIASALK